MKVYSPLDLQRMALTGVVIEPNGTAPAAPVDGLHWYDTGAHQLKVWNGTVWVTWYPNTTRLDQIVAPTSSVSLNGQKITLLSDPTNPTDAANKFYVDSMAQGIDAKGSVRAASTANVQVNSPGASLVLDGIPLNGQNCRVLLKNQTVPAENGLYDYSSIGASLLRTSDMNDWSEVPGAFTFVEQGTTMADTGWVCTSDVNGTLGTTAIVWTQFSGAGNYTGGNGLTLTGVDFSVNVDGVGIEIVSDILRLKDGGVTSAKILDGTIVAADLSSLLQDGTAGTKQIRALGLAATDAAAGNHSHTGLMPAPHATTHQPGGSDAMAVDAVAATGSLRTLGAGAQQAASGIHTHTVSQVSGAARSYADVNPALTANTWSGNITHNLAATNMDVGFSEVATGEGCMMDWRVNGINAIQMRAGVSVAAGAIAVVVQA